MSDNVTTLPRRGQTLLSGAGRTLSSSGQSPEGAEKWFKDVDPSTGALRSNKMVKCVLVRNTAGTTLYGKQIAKWKSGYRNKQVDGLSCVDFEECAGVIDDHLGSAGVPANDLFWLVVQGPALVRTSRAANAENVWSVGQVATALTAVTSGATTAGRPRPFAVTTTVTTIMSVAFNRIGRAMSAKTTAQSGESATPYVLLDLNIMT